MIKNDIVSRQNTPNILIVDDIPANLKVLGDILKGDGYKVRPVPSGTLALQAAEKEKPDLILLDIMMPGMDGYEVCRRIKKNPDLIDIPVIFISALNDTKDIVKALASGGADYITKPFQVEEVNARVKTHLKLYLQSKELQQKSKELQEMNVTKDKFFSIIAHDLRGPLVGLMGLAEIMADGSQLFTTDERKEISLSLSRSARNVFNLLDNLLKWSLMQRGQIAFKPQILSLKDVVAECVKIAGESARKKAIDIIFSIPIGYEVYADLNMLQAIILNLVSNAVKFTYKGGRVSVSAKLAENNYVETSINDTGIGMKNELIDKLFKLDEHPGRNGTDDEPSTGLGLLLSKEFVEKHSGKIWVESQEGKGSTFYFTIPSRK